MTAAIDDVLDAVLVPIHVPDRDVPGYVTGTIERDHAEVCGREQPFELGRWVCVRDPGHRGACP